MSTHSKTVTWMQAETIVVGVATSRRGVSALDRSDTRFEGNGVFQPGFLGDVSPWIVLGVVVFIVALLGALYLFVQIRQSMHEGEDTGRTVTQSSGSETSASGTAQRSTEEAEADTERQVDPETRERVLDRLPEDERKILGPVLESPGLTQVDVRDRSGFSKSKVSQTVTDLEDRGLLTRERQGRTYAIYPPDDIDSALEADESS